MRFMVYFSLSWGEASAGRQLNTNQNISQMTRDGNWWYPLGRHDVSNNIDVDELSLMMKEISLCMLI